MAGRRGGAAQAFHQGDEITPSGRHEVAPQVAEKPAAQLILGRAVGHQQILVAGVELKQAPLGQADFQQPPPMGEGDHLGKEGVAPAGVPQPSVLLHRQLRPGLDNPMRKHPTPVQPQRRSPHLRPHLHAGEAAAWRALHEDEAEHPVKEGRLSVREGAQRIREVLRRPVDAQGARTARSTDQANGRPRRPHANAHLRADSAQPKPAAQFIAGQGGGGVAAVITDRLAGQAGAYANGQGQLGAGGERRMWARPHLGVARKSHTWSAPRLQMRRPNRACQWASLPNSSRQAQSRRVKWCSGCS